MFLSHIQFPLILLFFNGLLLFKIMNNEIVQFDY